jgi:nucleotide-binding universal stress UspA family protein
MLHFRRILFPVDFSLRCRQTASLVADVARKFSSDVILLHALDPLPTACYAPEFNYFSPDAFLESQRQTMTAELAEFAETEFPNVALTELIVNGDPADSIAEAVARQHIDLIIMPTHGRGLFRRLLLGSVTSKVLHDTACPVLTDAHSERFPTRHCAEIRRILCATDTGMENVPVLRAAADVAAEYGAGVHLIHALPGQEAYYENNIDPGLRQFLMRLAKERIACLQHEAATDWELCVKAAPVAEAVRKTAEEYGADLLVIGRGRVKEHFGPMRTNSTAIIRESPCPVLSV